MTLCGELFSFHWGGAGGTDCLFEAISGDTSTMGKTCTTYQTDKNFFLELQNISKAAYTKPGKLIFCGVTSWSLCTCIYINTWPPFQCMTLASLMRTNLQQEINLKFEVVFSEHKSLINLESPFHKVASMLACCFPSYWQMCLNVWLVSLYFRCRPSIYLVF